MQIKKTAKTCSIVLAICPLTVLTLTLAFSQPKTHPLRILVVTGGHSFDEGPFFQVFKDMPGVTFKHVRFRQKPEEKFPEEEAERFLNAEAARDFDAMVFYDMHQRREPHWQGWMELLARGKGTVFLHHALGSYRLHSAEYQEVVGGSASFLSPPDPKVANATSWRHDVAFRVRIADRQHPITQGVADFDVVDETYKGFLVSPGVHPLLAVDHPDSNKVIAWTHRYKKSPIVYLELGHGPTAFNNPNFRLLLERSIRWVAGKVPEKAKR